MLLEIRIKDFGIIENLRFRPGSGLNVITGESGAGKSLLLNALEMALGSRSFPGVVKSGSHKAVVEALFDLSAQPDLSARFGDYLELRREISAEGRSRSYINGAAATLVSLRSLATGLIEIHGQHEHQRILNPDTHLDYLDIFAGSEELRDEVAELYQRYSSIRGRIRAAGLEAEEREQRLEQLHFALDEIQSFDLRENEYEELLQERELIHNSGQLFQDLYTLYGLLRQEEGAVLDRLEAALALLESHVALLKGGAECAEQMREALYLLEAATEFIRQRKEKIDFSPERLEYIEGRLAGYQRLHKKYGGNSQAVLHTRNNYLTEIASVEMSSEELEKLKEEYGELKKRLFDRAERLSRLRQGSVAALEANLADELAQLGMPGARIRVSIQREIELQNEEEEEMENNCQQNTNPLEQLAENSSFRGAIYEKGFDRVEFFLAANRGEPFRPLRRVVSGGELSRIALALKGIFFAGRPVDSLVFDEVDAGVGGELAHTIGQRLKSLAAHSQLLVITHLHQIARLADSHFRLCKTHANQQTEVSLTRLGGEERLEEMARILGGELPGPAVRQHARELLVSSNKTSNKNSED